MDTIQKQLLGWAGLALMVLVGMYVIVKTNKEANTATTTNTVSFSGEGKVFAKPDIALVDLSIVTEGATSKAAQDSNSKKSKTVVDFLKKQGIAEKDIKTTGYNIYPQYTSKPCPRDALCPAYTGTQISGYQVNEMIQVKIRDLDKTDTILAGVVGAGANQINQLQLTIENPEKLREEARQKAIEDAKNKAEILEDQLGVHLGRIINFTEGSGGYPMPMYLKDAAYGMGGGGNAVAPAIAQGQTEISTSVTITYQIK